MPSTDLADTARAFLNTLCLDIPTRCVGSDGNREATDLFASAVRSFGFRVETPEFDCIDWRQEGAQILTERASFQPHVSPYSLGCSVTAPLTAISTLEELDAAQLSDTIALLYGPIASQQLMPKNFPFYNPDEHKRIIRHLEMKKPLAIITATSRDPEMVGSMYPFPLFEDGDFDIPSVYLTDIEGDLLLESVGADVYLDSRAQRIPSRGCNVIARKGANQNRRVVLFAHIDAKMCTPGASDNAGGVLVLLLLAGLLACYSGNLTIELVAMNGEDYFSAPGEQQYLTLNTGRFDEIALGINIDGAGYHKGSVAYSLYDCPDAVASAIHETLAAHDGIVEGPPWYQGDHGIFLMQQRPALAFTSALVSELMREITHTPKDTPDILDVTKLVTLAKALRDLLLRLDRLVV